MPAHFLSKLASSELITQLEEPELLEFTYNPKNFSERER